MSERLCKTALSINENELFENYLIGFCHLVRINFKKLNSFIKTREIKIAECQTEFLHRFVAADQYCFQLSSNFLHLNMKGVIRSLPSKGYVLAAPASSDGDSFSHHLSKFSFNKRMQCGIKGNAKTYIVCIREELEGRTIDSKEKGLFFQHKLLIIVYM